MTPDLTTETLLDRLILNRFKLFFFINFMGTGVLMPYLPLYLLEKDLNAVQIGLLLGILPMVKIIAQPVWGLVGDAYHANRMVLTLSLLALAGMSLLFSAASSFGAILAVVIFFGIMEAPYIPFGTALALDYLERHGHPEMFGPLRTWGSVGFVISTLIVGALLIDFYLARLPVVFAGVMATAALLSIALPDSGHAEKAFRLSDGVRLLAERSSYAVLLAGLVLAGMALGIFAQYLPIYLKGLSAAGWIIGVLLATQAALEIPLMARGPQILQRIGTATALLVGVSVLPLRSFLYLVVHSPILLLPVQLLHGVTMSGLMVAGAIYVSRLLSPQLRATGQSLMVTAYGGIGWSLGPLTAGPIFASWGINGIWIYSLVCGASGAAVVALALRLDK